MKDNQRKAMFAKMGKRYYDIYSKVNVPIKILEQTVDDDVYLVEYPNKERSYLYKGHIGRKKINQS